MSDIELFPDDDAQPAQVIQRVVASGLPLATGLRAYAEECPLSARQGLLQLALAVESGMSLEDAMQGGAIRLPQYLSGLIDGGIRSQRLAPMLEEYLHQRRTQRRVGQNVALDLAYPLLVAYFAGLVCFGLLAWLVPMFTGIFEGFDMELPMLTQALIELSGLCVTWKYPIGVGFVVALVAILVFLFAGRLSTALLDRLPFFGLAARYASMSEFCSLLAPLVETSVPLPEALRAVAATMHPSTLKGRATALANRYDGAFDLADVAGQQKFPHEIVHVLRWEQRGSAFGEILRSWSQLFARMAAGRSSVISAILAPLLMVGIGLLVGLILFALFLPLIKLLNELS